MKDKKDWEKIKTKFYCEFVFSDGYLAEQKPTKILNFFKKEFQQAKQEGKQDLKKKVEEIVSDYQGFKIDTLGLEMKLCELINDLNS